MSSSFSFPSRAISRVSRLFASKGKSVSVLVRLLLGCTFSLKIRREVIPCGLLHTYLGEFQNRLQSCPKGEKFICPNSVINNTDVNLYSSQQNSLYIQQKEKHLLQSRTPDKYKVPEYAQPSSQCEVQSCTASAVKKSKWFSITARLEVSIGFLRPKEIKWNALAQARVFMTSTQTAAPFWSVAPLFKDFQQWGTFCHHH